MVCIRVDGHEVPIVFPLKGRVRAKIDSHLLHICFRFVELSIYVEEERKLESGELQHVVPVMKFMEGNRHFWYLACGNYRAYEVPLFLLYFPTKIINQQSFTSTIDMPYITQTMSLTPPHVVFPLQPSSHVPQEVKVEKADPNIELFIKSVGQYPKFSLLKKT